MTLRVALSGASGRMGQLVSAALTAAGDAVVSGFNAHNLPSPEGMAGVDVVIDFSTPEALRGLVPLLPPGLALVSGTTGLDTGDRELLRQQSKHGPVLHASNFSPGVALLRRLLADAAAAWPEADVEIIDTHHRRKIDAPSGTALGLARVAADARRVSLESVAVYGRRGTAGPRPEGEIGIHAVRAGGVFGEHRVVLAMEHEILEISHSAGSRAVFADGAVRAARWLVGRPPGLYSASDVLGR